MKRNLLSIIAVVMMSVVALNASAQNVKYGNTQDFEACVKYLSEHKGDTIREALPEPVVELSNVPNDTTVTRGKLIINLKKGDDLVRDGIDVIWGDDSLPRGPHYKIINKTILPPKMVADSSEVKCVDRKAEKTQVNLIAQSYGQEQDIYFYEASVHETTDGKIVDRFNNKNGLRLVLPALGYRLGLTDGGKIHSFTLGAGFELTSDWGGFTRVLYRFGTAIHPDNAVNPDGSYTTHGLRPSFGYRAKLDTYGQWYLELSAGPGLDYQKCETQKNQNGLLQSNVFVVYPFAEIGVSYEPFGSHWGGYTTLGWEQSQILKQNDGNSGSNNLTWWIGLTYRF